MVRRQIVRRGIRDRRVMQAMRKVQRHCFVPDRVKFRAYDDAPLPIGNEQTISQPYVVASMTEELSVRPEHKILEIGTGSGYQTAVLAELCEHVYTLELVEELHKRATALFGELGYDNISSRLGSDLVGFNDMAPFDGILVAAVASSIPEALINQLAVGGRLIIPVYTEDGTEQELLAIRKTKYSTEVTKLYGVLFVPLVYMK